jgi:hypothetical protein
MIGATGNKWTQRLFRRHMKLIVLLLACAAAPSLACSAAQPAASQASPNADAPAPAAAIAAVHEAEDRWNRAEATGDKAYLEELLDPAYVSLSSNGVPHDKAAILAHAERFAAEHPGAPAEPMPATSTIHVKGTTAVVRHHGANEASVDVFYFADGRWRAWYSQHTKTGA